MATTQVTFRIDENLKKRAEKLFDEMGINMTTALNAFVKATVREGKMPFALVSDEYASKQMIREKLEESIAIAADPKAERLNHEDIFAPIREKFGYEI